MINLGSSFNHHPKNPMINLRFNLGDILQKDGQINFSILSLSGMSQGLRARLLDSLENNLERNLKKVLNEI